MNESSFTPASSSRLSPSASSGVVKASEHDGVRSCSAAGRAEGIDKGKAEGRSDEVLGGSAGEDSGVDSSEGDGNIEDGSVGGSDGVRGGDPMLERAVGVEPCDARGGWRMGTQERLQSQGNRYA